MIALARKTLVHEWRRFVPAILAVAFSGVLLAVQAGLVLGIFGSAAVYVTASNADVWVGYPGTQSVNYGREINPDVEMRLRMDPEVDQVEPYWWVDGDWYNWQRSGGGVSVYVSGIQTGAKALLFARILPPTLRVLLRQPGAVIVDQADLQQLGTAVGGNAWLNGQRVQVVAAISGLRGLGGVNVLASTDTARRLQPGDANTSATYWVATLRQFAKAVNVLARLEPQASQRGTGITNPFGAYAVWTADEFARRSQLYWLLDTGAGITVLFMAAIVCVVGAVLTSQSLMAVVTSSAREYATLNALGVSLFSLSRVVLEQASWIGVIGLLIGGSVSAGLLWVASLYGVPAAMNLPVALGCVALVAVLVLASGLWSVRSLVRTEPAMLLR